ncbi:MAG: hypothetical protein IJM71_08810, partial [Clostridia bacterium]|nr:hypothetical protein [Clostridia bacterium]
MKKIVTVCVSLLTLAMVIAFAIPVYAGTSYAPNGTGWGSNNENEVQVKKAERDKVVKDGLIGTGEYEKLNVDLDADNGTSPLFVVGFTSASLENALVMLPT